MILSLVFQLACSSGTSEEKPTDDGVDTGVDQTDTGEDTETDNPSDSGDTTETGEDSDSEDTNEGGVALIHTQALTTIVHQAFEAEMIPVSIRCLQEADSGISLLEDRDISVMVSPMDGVTIDQHMVSFTQPGAYRVQCGDVDVMDTEIIVIREVLSPATMAVSLSLSEANQALWDLQILDENDEQALMEAYMRLQISRDQLPFEIGPFRNIPLAFWPTDEQLQLNGIVPSLDDAELDVALQEIGLRIQELLALFQSLDPELVTEEELSNIEALDQQLEEAFSLLEGIEPSFMGWRDSQAMLNEIVLLPLRELSFFSLQWQAMNLEQTGGGPGLSPLTLEISESTITMAQKTAARIRSSNRIYSRLVSGIDVSIRGLMDAGILPIEPSATDPVVLSRLDLSASEGLVTPGYSSSLYGLGFSQKVGLNIAYVVPTAQQTSLETALSDCNMGINLPMMEHLEQAENCRLQADGIAIAGAGEALVPDGAEYELSLGAFVTGCPSGTAQPVGVMVWNMETGMHSPFYPLECVE